MWSSQHIQGWRPTLQDFWHFLVFMALCHSHVCFTFLQTAHSGSVLLLPFFVLSLPMWLLASLPSHFIFIFSLLLVCVCLLSLPSLFCVSFTASYSWHLQIARLIFPFYFSAFLHSAPIDFLSTLLLYLLCLACIAYSSLYPDDRGSSFLWKLCTYLPDYMASLPRKKFSSLLEFLTSRM